MIINLMLNNNALKKQLNCIKYKHLLNIIKINFQKKKNNFDCYNEKI